MRFCRFLEMSLGGSAAGQPQRTEPCQRVSDQPWKRHSPVQGQMQHLECAGGVEETALGAAAGLGRWVVGVANLQKARVFLRCGAVAWQPQRTEPCHCVSYRPGHVLGHWKVKCSLCSAQQVWWSLYWVLRQASAGGLGGLRFCQILVLFSDGCCARQPLRTEPCRCVSDQPWAYHGPL